MVTTIFKGTNGHDMVCRFEMGRCKLMSFKVTSAKVLTLVALMLVIVQTAAEAASIKIVAIGASNTWGWGVRYAYPERLEALLRARGFDAHVINAGINFDTTKGMLNRLHDAVPDGTQIVILQPGRNDLRFFGTKKQRANNIKAIVERLRVRKIHVIVVDPAFPSDYYQWDRIHYKSKAHAKIAAELLSQVEAIVDREKH
jgi:acyl-CoA thioesterase I